MPSPWTFACEFPFLPSLLDSGTPTGDETHYPIALSRAAMQDNEWTWKTLRCAGTITVRWGDVDYAATIDAVIITKDEDFAQRRALVDEGPQIVWVRLPNVRRRDLLVWFEKALPGIVLSLDLGETLVEVI